MRTTKNDKKKDASLKKETQNLLKELDLAYKEIRKSQNHIIIKERLKLASEIAAGISDKLRNQLNIINMSAQYLSNQFTEEDEKKEFIKKIMERIENLNNMAINLLNFATPREPNLENYHINEILDRILKLVKYKCIVHRIKIIRNYSSNIPPVKIDPDMMEQVFLNIIDNALWAMQNGGNLYINTRFLKSQNSVQIKIKDAGKGISKYDLPKIFDPLFGRKENGTGLGLSIAYRIIKEHKGSIKADSSPGKGTSFSIELPIS